MNKNTKRILLISLIIIFFLPILVAAESNLEDAFSGTLLKDVSRKAGYSGYVSVYDIIGYVIQGALSILGIVFLILMVYSGYAWMTAHGDEQKVTKAKDTIHAAIIGLIVVLGAYAISYFVVSKLGAGTLQQTTGAQTPPAN
jgi:hypothetical protein